MAVSCFNWTKGLPEVLSFILHPVYAVARIFHMSSMPMIYPKQILPPLSWKPVFPGVSHTDKQVRGKATRRAQMSITEGLLEDQSGMMDLIESPQKKATEGNEIK
ncbi:hypothetical protein U9M48_012376 [Paspalum notatum var. saurae]|uniref:Uncharacterized protein n=1 Tax=Paspalum notatum var. saurae TaxID=547442 RepID=A0AAQ3SXT1_PASNO